MVGRRFLCGWSNPFVVRASLLLLCLCFASQLAERMLAAPPEEIISFKRDVRPILSDLCFACHGPDVQHRQADLRIDTPEGVKSIISNHDPENSELYRRIVTSNIEERMPPPKSNKQLSVEQQEILRRWIEQGSPWEDHWSFSPLKKPPVPELSSSSSNLLHPIDAFVRSPLQRRGWSWSPEADRRTLIRRVTLDLTGLPPTIEEVEDFLNDPSPNAYERVVSRLLQSTAFGERMAWDWLDAARYADSNGYQGDNERTMWPWRDWVVKAFNDNLPFDQFTIWQLAGDMLPNATPEQKLATGFCRNHMINGEGGRIAEENRVDYVMDMTETMGTVWLGLTLNCCRCHDHKFDPIQQQEYYQLFAFFNQTPVTGAGRDAQTPPILAAPTQEQQRRLETIDRQLDLLQTKKKMREEQLAVEHDRFEASLRSSFPSSLWKLGEIQNARGKRQTLKVEADHTVLASGTNPENDEYEIVLRPYTDAIQAIRLDALQHESMTKKGLSRAESGNFVLTSFEVYVDREGPDSQRRRIPIKDGKGTFEQANHPIHAAFDEDPKSGWAVWKGKTVDRSHAAYFRLEEPLFLKPQERLVVVLKHESTNAQHNIGYFRLALSSSQDVNLDEFDPALEVALATPLADRTKQQRALLTTRQRQSDQEYRSLEAELQSSQEERKKALAVVPKVMVMEELKEPRETYFLTRGLYNQPGKKVVAGVPQSLPSLRPDRPVNRLSMAEWLVSDEQPLTPRVVVNRFWQQFFGTGLTKTVEDVGSQGEIPRYLDLLDWLAADFRESGWNTKRLVEQIVTSQTYRQSSRFLESPLAVDDPENRWLARGPRFRMPSWMLRDQALAASGLLVKKIGGPSVNGYQPEGVWEEATFGKKKYEQDRGESLYRRSLYTFWRRIIGPTMFFDNAARQVCTVKTVRTNTPLHALFMLNDVTFVEASRTLATNLLNKTLPEDSDRLDHLFQIVLARHALSEERALLLKSLQRSREEFARQKELARELISVGESKAPDDLSEVELASWTSVCLAVLNLDETLTKE